MQLVRATKRGRGRPRNQPMRSVIEINVSPHERAAMEQAAARAGYTAETWLLRIALKEAGIGL